MQTFTEITVLLRGLQLLARDLSPWRDVGLINKGARCEYSPFLLHTTLEHLTENIEIFVNVSN